MREFHYRWEWRLRSSPERLWPLAADTNSFNRDAGVPALELGEVRPGGRRLLRLSKLGIPIEWEEEPFEWIESHRFSVVRRYATASKLPAWLAGDVAADARLLLEPR